MSRIVFYLFVLFSTLNVSYAADRQDPKVFIDKLDMDVIHRISAIKGNLKKARAIVDTYISDKFDFRIMTAMVTGRAWRSANEDARVKLISNFKGLLINTYTAILGKYSGERITVVSSKSMNNRSIVNIEINGADIQTLKISYCLIFKTDLKIWKIYDVKLAGVSLVKGFKDGFDKAYRLYGLDGLIKLIGDKERASR